MTEHTLHAALLPPGPAHTHGSCSLALETNALTAIVGGLWASLSFDYLVKVSGKTNVNRDLVAQFPAPVDHAAAMRLLLRALRLNCLTEDYAPLWEEAFEDAFLDEAWTPPYAHRPSLHDVAPEWTMTTPLRTEFDRRAALVEIDALAAIMLSLTADQLCAIYRAQFPVLRKFEHRMYFDVQGRKIAKDHQTYGAKQQKGDYELVEAWMDEPGSVELPDRYQPPFPKPDREADMLWASAESARRLAARWGDP